MQITSRGPRREGVESIRGSRYTNRRFRQTLRMLQSPTGVIVEGHVYRALVDQGFALDLDRDNKSVYDPKDLFTALDRYTRWVDLNVDEAAWDKAYSATLAAFGSGGKSLNVLENSQDIVRSLKLEKSSGAPEFTTKGEAVERDFARALRTLKGEVAPAPCVAYHRVQHGSSGPKTRLVWGYPLSMTILEAMFARPLIDHYLSGRGAMAFGLRKHEIAARLVPIVNSPIRYGVDFSGFDSSISPNLIRMAFNVLKTYFPTMDMEHTGVWNMVIDYFINTPIIMPDGYVYRKQRGVPSGSYFTQMIDSIVNFFAVQYASVRIRGRLIPEGKLLVLGDDSIFGTGEFVNLRAYARELGTLGLKMNVEKSVQNCFPADLHFLGHAWDRGLVDREPLEVAKRMAFPETVSSIKDGRVRIPTRMYAYLSDAKSAWPILKKWAFYEGNDVSALLGKQTSSQPITGWMEHSSIFEPGIRNWVGTPFGNYAGLVL